MKKYKISLVPTGNMNRTLIFKIILQILFLSANLLEAKYCFFTREYIVYIFDELPPGSGALRLHCASGDDDLGFHTLYSSQDFSWKFCEGFLKNTLFFCHFWWGSKNLAFEVFNLKRYEERPDGLMIWSARKDGIYLQPKKDGSLEKMYSW